MKARKFVSLLVAIMFLFAACNQAPGPAPELKALTHVTPRLIDGNPTCSQLIPGSTEIKVDINDLTLNGVYGPVTITALNADKTTLSFSSQIPILGVVMKGSNAGNFYDYQPNGTLADSGLVTPTNSSGNPAQISHVSFCYVPKLVVSKTANTYKDRDWTWAIVKTSEETEVGPLNPNTSRPVNYTVEVSATNVDTNTRIDGTITITNPTFNGGAATITSVTDQVAPGSNATVTGCTVGGANVGVPTAANPYMLASGATMTCTYSATSWGDSTSGTNTAMVTTSGTVRGSTGTAPWNFASATTENETDECIDVTDDMGTPSDANDDRSLGRVCANQLVNGEYTFAVYQIDVGALATECGENRVTNTASFVTNDNDETGDDDHTVVVTVECVVGCSLTQGYWKNHADPNRKQFDPTWNLIRPAGAQTTFYLSGQTYLQVLNTSVSGNQYYSLAHQYIAAQLNILAGADGSAISTQMARAEAIFKQYTPAQIGALRSNSALRQEIIALANHLAKYNEGLIGPGHCDSLER
jgi:hypothetical protein